jgi:outer membrane protein TolC
VPRAALAALLILTSCIPYAPRPLDPAANAAAVEGRRLDDPALRVYAEQSLGHPFATWPPATWDLEALTAAALYFNPDVAVARAEHASALAAVTTAQERPNPAVNASLQHKDSDPALSPWVSSFGIDLTIETAGKRAARVAQANESAEAAQARIASVAWSVRSRLRARLLDVFAAELRTPVFTDEERIESDIVAIFAKRLELGEASRPDLSRARIALDQTRLLLLGARRAAAEGHAGVAGAIGIPDAALGAVDVQAFAVTPPGDLAASREAALTARPDVLAALHDFASADAALRLEVARQYPDVHFTPSFGWDQGTLTWLLGAAADVPLFHRHEGPIGEAVAKREEAAARFTAVQVAVLSSLDAAGQGVRFARERLDAAEALVKSQQTQFATVQRQFDAGEIDRLALRSSELEVAAARLARADAWIELQQALGATEDAMQRPLTK